jgi:hypothetical protein
MTAMFYDGEAEFTHQKHPESGRSKPRGSNIHPVCCSRPLGYAGTPGNRRRFVCFRYVSPEFAYRKHELTLWSIGSHVRVKVGPLERLTIRMGRLWANARHRRIDEDILELLTVRVGED